MARHKKLSVENEFGIKALELYKKGYSIYYIREELIARGLPIHYTTIKKFIEKNLNKTEAQPATIEVLRDEGDFEQLEIDFAKWQDELGLNLNANEGKLTLSDTDKIVNQIFLLTGIALMDYLDRFSKGGCKYPREMFRCYEIALHALNLTQGINRAENISKAIALLENKSNGLTEEMVKKIRMELYGI